MLDFDFSFPIKRNLLYFHSAKNGMENGMEKSKDYVCCISITLYLYNTMGRLAHN